MRRQFTAISALALCAAFLPIGAAPLDRGAALAVVASDIRPYRICRAKVIPEEGFPGSLRVIAIDFTGAERTLFEATYEAYAEAAQVAFYLDEEIKSLRFEASLASGRAVATIDLGADTPIADAAETARLARMRVLAPPPYLVGSSAPYRLAFNETSIEGASGPTTGMLAPRPPLAALAVLAAFVGAATALESVKNYRARLGAIIVTSVIAALAAVLLARPEAVLAVVRLPNAADKADAAAPRLSGRLEAVEEAQNGILMRRYGERHSGAEGGLSLIGLATPGRSTVPLSLVMGDLAIGEDVNCRFFKPPLIIERDGSFALRAHEPMLGWLLHARP